MNIDLSSLSSDSEIDITGNYKIDDKYFENSDIISLSDVNVSGVVYLNEDDIYCCRCFISGDMLIPDSITLEGISYHYDTDYDDIIEQNCINGENLLDIFEFLWENIVLEVPLRFTKVKDLSKFHGDGWKLVSEDELTKSNNPFSDLLEKYNDGKE